MADNPSEEHGEIERDIRRDVERAEESIKKAADGLERLERLEQTEDNRRPSGEVTIDAPPPRPRSKDED